MSSSPALASSTAMCSGSRGWNGRGPCGERSGSPSGPRRCCTSDCREPAPTWPQRSNGSHDQPVDGDLIGLCAAGEAAWHAAAFSGLGASWREDSGLAWGPAGAPHRFLLAAVTLVPKPPLPSTLRAGGLGELCDSWASFTDEDLPGWTSVSADPWMVRAAAPCDVPAVSGVRVERTYDALLFEHTAFLAAGGPPPVVPGELHPAGSEAIDGLFLFLARRGDAPVGTALAVRHARGVVVSAVNVLPAERGRGIGALLTACAVGIDPAARATLTASQLGLRVYRRLGFCDLAPALHWQPPPT